ncbi:SIMPL domain-containing protein [Roseitranquillus sediminis]|uniref:SIMPL domain-containing protein n=1 Tax=Roseitranquillus sediminis TaxID=2809051 RepID=UPI001D0C6B35|nr:SIMPL domain-containing protein [Roseitranquillus sediminis]MBM9594556.1 SIMPL domain-containing protein [Roseitranquillus sediminis]
MRFMPVVLAVLLSGAVQAQEAPSLTVQGEGQVAAVPDLATLSVGVTTQAGTAGEALERNSQAMAAVLERLRQEGVEDRDLQTDVLSLSPRYADRPAPDGGHPEVMGYVAENTLRVRVRDLDRLGAVLDAVADEGANTFRGLNFGMQEPQPLRDEALREAVADATRKAELLADEAGVALGEVLRLDAAEPQRGPFPQAEMRMAMDSVPVARGEVGIEATVTMEFAIGAAE